MGLKAVGWKCLEWIYLVQGRDCVKATAELLSAFKESLYYMELIITVVSFGIQATEAASVRMSVECSVGRLQLK
jgi:hypothetical protein